MPGTNLGLLMVYIDYLSYQAQLFLSLELKRNKRSLKKQSGEKNIVECIIHHLFIKLGLYGALAARRRGYEKNP